MARASRVRSFSVATIGALMVGLALTSTGTFAPHAGAQTASSPIVKKHLYPEIGSAQADLKAALAEARMTHKRVIVDFGGDWCGDCQVLDIYLHQPPNAELLAKNFVKVNVNVGPDIDANLDIGKRFGVPLKKGVPALAVLDSHGKVLYAQQGEFENMRNMQSASVTAFLTKWKP